MHPHVFVSVQEGLLGSYVFLQVTGRFWKQSLWLGHFPLVTERAEMTFCEEGAFGAVREDTLAGRAIVLSLSPAGKGVIDLVLGAHPSTRHRPHPRP